MEKRVVNQSSIIVSSRFAMKQNSLSRIGFVLNSILDYKTIFLVWILMLMLQLVVMDIISFGCSFHI